MTKDEVVQSISQSEEVQKEKVRILELVQEDKQRRDQATSFFRNENLATYTEAGRAQFIGHREKPEWKKDYQYNVFDPVTRDKVMAIISKAGGLYEAQFFNTNKRLQNISETISTVLGAFYKDSSRRLNEEEKNKLIMLSALITPKAIWYEGWRHQMRTIREIEERDQNGEVSKAKEKKIVHYNGPYGELVPVEDFIPGSLRIRDIQEQPRLAWISRMQLSEFKRLYPETRYPEAKKVRPFGELFQNDISEFTIRNDYKEREVEVIKFFEKWEDRMSIIANGVMLTKVNAPMPFAHKDYPFVWGGFEEIDPHFIYDMPLTIKLLDMQDVNNEILNLSLDMVWRALNEVVLVGNGDGINDDVLYGGGLVAVNNPANFNKLEFGSSFGFNASQGVMNRVRQSIESSSVDAPSAGTSGVGGRTAREVLVAREAALEIASVFLRNMENMERDKAYLRVKNQLDRYRRPVEWKKIIGEDLTEQAIPMFREISVRDAKLDDGRRGRVNIRITDIPRSQSELDKENTINEKELSQTIDISPEFIREIQFETEIVANSSIKRSKSEERADARGFLSDAIAMPQVLNVDYAAKEYVKALGKNQEEALARKQEVPEGMQGMTPQATQSPLQKPMQSQDSLEEMLNASL